MKTVLAMGRSVHIYVHLMRQSRGAACDLCRRLMQRQSQLVLNCVKILSVAKGTQNRTPMEIQTVSADIMNHHHESLSSVTSDVADSGKIATLVKHR